MSVILVVSITVLCAGCATQRGVDIAREARTAYEAFIAQNRIYQPITLRGEAMEITFRNVTELTFAAPLPPLAAMPQQNDTPARIADAAKNTFLGGLGIWSMARVATSPTVIHQQQPLVVRPEVIQSQVIQAQ